LFALGAGDQVIGIGTAEAYPPEALELPSYSYSKDDVEKFIAANPDVIFFREAVATKYEDLVSELEGAGIKVIALQNTDFDNYVTTIAKVVGKEDTAQDMLEDFHAQMDALKARADKIPEEERVGVFFESRAKEYNTASQSSIAYNGLELINVVNVAKENMEKDTTSSIADFGEEYLLAEADNIDVYIAQLGVMNKEVSIESIKSRPGFDVIKAIKDDRIFIVDEKLISSLTFRQIEGLTQVFEYVYPEY
jgi:iron complex transport system substrate-binding protein